MKTFKEILNEKIQCEEFMRHGTVWIPENIAEDAAKEYAEQFKQPTAQGWECPRCHKIHSWLHMECDCPPKVMTATTNLQPEITDEDIEEWARGLFPVEATYYHAYIKGAQAMRDGEITKK